MNTRFFRKETGSSATAGLLGILFASGLLLALSRGDMAAAEPVKSGAPEQKIRVLLVTGMDYPGHVWRLTSPTIREALSHDSRLEVFTIEDPHFLDSAALARYDVMVMHWQNWEQPGPGASARTNLQHWLEGGKGLVLVHFACGAWHGEWPEFDQVAGRVWFGSNPGPGKRQHDPYGVFKVEFPNPTHPIAAGMSSFETSDELYTCLMGDRPIEVVAQARSKIDNQEYPMAFVSTLGKGRTFHCTLGHDVKALSVPEVQELYRRGVAWAAGKAPTNPPTAK
jgi:type 1 glutamine amidotransferase